MSDMTVSALRAAFGRGSALELAFDTRVIEPVTLPPGYLRRLPAALARATLVGGVNRTWSATAAELELATYLDRCAAAGAIDAYRNAIGNGWSWAWCDQCGEPTLVPRRHPGTLAKCHVGCHGEAPSK